MHALTVFVDTGAYNVVLGGVVDLASSIWNHVLPVVFERDWLILEFSRMGAQGEHTVFGRARQHLY